MWLKNYNLVWILHQSAQGYLINAGVEKFRTKLEMIKSTTRCIWPLGIEVSWNGSIMKKKLDFYFKFQRIDDKWCCFFERAQFGSQTWQHYERVVKLGVEVWSDKIWASQRYRGGAFKSIVKLDEINHVELLGQIYWFWWKYYDETFSFSIRTVLWGYQSSNQEEKFMFKLQPIVPILSTKFERKWQHGEPHSKFVGCYKEIGQMSLHVLFLPLVSWTFCLLIDSGIRKLICKICLRRISTF